MVVQIKSNGPIHLLALGLSQKASTQVQEIRQTLWQASGDISFLSLPPTIPLMWSQRPFTPFERVTLPRLPRSTTFSQLREQEHNLFLHAEDAQWPTTIAQLLEPYSSTAPQTTPFPSFSGIYLGSATLREEINFLPVITDDWRLLYYSVEWETDAEKLVSLRYTITSDRHLLPS